MTSPGDLVDRDPDPLDRADLRAMLDAAGMDGPLESVDPVGRGSDVVYVLVVGGERVVLKHPQHLDDETFRAEPRLLGVVAERTSIPVPEPLAAVEDHGSVPAPFYVMEHLGGADPEALDEDPGPDARVRIARTAGRHLAALHDLGPLAGFGQVDAVDGDLAVPDPTTREEWLRGYAGFALDGLADGRFADLEPALREHVERELAWFAGQNGNAPVPTHGDYRPGNLLVDPDTWAVRAVLDWGGLHAAPAEFELAKTEQFLSRYAPPGEDLRERVRAALLDGYEAHRDLARDAGFERRRRLYRLTTRLHAMYWLAYWHEDATDAGRNRVAEDHRAAVGELLP